MVSDFGPRDRVRLRITDSLKSEHYLRHARRGDVGVVVSPGGPVTKLSDVYVLVKFTNCHIRHRFTAHELDRLE